MFERCTYTFIAPFVHTMYVPCTYVFMDLQICMYMFETCTCVFIFVHTMSVSCCR